MPSRRDSLGNDLSRKMSGSARKLSRVSLAEVQASTTSLQGLFASFSDDESNRMSSAQFVKLCEECSLVDKRCKSSDAQLIFASTQIGKLFYTDFWRWTDNASPEGKNPSITFERFQEAFRKLAVKKEMTYQELVDQGTRNFSGSTVAIDQAGAVPFCLILWW